MPSFSDRIKKIFHKKTLWRFIFNIYPLVFIISHLLGLILSGKWKFIDTMPDAGIYLFARLIEALTIGIHVFLVVSISPFKCSWLHFIVLCSYWAIIPILLTFAFRSSVIDIMDATVFGILATISTFIPSPLAKLDHAALRLYAGKLLVLSAIVGAYCIRAIYWASYGSDLKYGDALSLAGVTLVFIIHWYLNSIWLHSLRNVYYLADV